MALVPLTVVASIGARASVQQLRDAAKETLEHDLRLAESQTAQLLRSAESHVMFLAQSELRLPLLGEEGQGLGHDASLAATQLVATEPTLHQVKVIDMDGRERLTVSRHGVAVPTNGELRGLYYAYRARRLRRGDRLLLPIELASDSLRGPLGANVAAVAVIVPVFSRDDSLRGIVVGEAYASQLFAGLDQASPGFGGVTALIDSSGHFLYHSLRKRDWASLLASRDRVRVSADFPVPVVKALLGGSTGTLVTSDGDAMVSYRPLLPGGDLATGLTLYRAVPVAQLTTSVRHFVAWVVAGGAGVVVVVLLISVAAADQFTRPIYRIREGAWRLARGEPAGRIEVETNDEFEDLARDFAQVAATIEAHRDQREAVLRERTEALQLTHAELSEVVTHSADAIIGLDAQGKVRLWNRGAERLFGYPADDVIGQDADALIGNARDGRTGDAPYIQQELEREGEVIDFQTTRYDRGGAAIPVSLTHTVRRGLDGRVIGASVIVRDRSVQERVDQQMRRVERLAAMSVVAAGLAHEVNNPLGIIANRIELMQRDAARRGSDPQLARDLDVLGEHVKRLSGVTTDLLRFARDDGEADDRTDVRAVATRLRDLLARTFASRGLALDLSVPALPAIVRGSERAIESVVLNLLLNAADATPSGGRVGIELQSDRAEGFCVLRVVDTGAGVPEPLRARIFEPLFTTKPAGLGTGLGLTVCRSIVDRLGGQVTLESTPSGGAAFVVRLPLDGERPV